VHAPGLAARSPPIDGSDGVAAADAQRGQLPREVGTPRAKLVADQDGGGIRHPRIEGGALVSRACRGEVRPDAALRRVEHGPDDEGPRGERYDRDDDDRDGGSADHASARSFFSAASTPSGASNTADPATTTLAPASTTRRTLSSFTPPSTSSSTARWRASISLRRRWSLPIALSMNFCPPKPGLTLMTSARSTSVRYGRIASTGVAGLSVIPALAPRVRMRESVAETARAASTWTTTYAAPPST